MKKNGNNPPPMDLQEAMSVLDKVFEQCEVEPNSVPIEALAAYTAYRRERSIMKKVLLVLAIIAVLLVSLMFVKPSFSVKETEGEIPGLPEYTVEVSTFLPVYAVTARQDTRGLSVREEDNHTYKVEPVRNGTMEIFVTLINRQTKSITVEVDGVDHEGPVFRGSRVEDGKVFVFVHDEGSGVDYENAYAISGSGDYYEPVETDPAAGAVIFEYPDEVWDIYIPDRIGNTLHLAARIE